MNQKQIDKWKKQAKTKNCKFLVIAFDLEDMETYPIFTDEDPKEIDSRFVSETKQKIITFFEMF